MRVDPASESADIDTVADSDSDPDVALDFEVRLVVEPDEPPVVVVRGEIDRASVGAFEAALMEAMRFGSLVEVDMQGLTFIDSAGLRALYTAQLRLGQCPEALVLRDPNPAVTRILRLGQLERLLTIRATRRCSSAGRAPQPTRPGATSGSPARW